MFHLSLSVFIIACCPSVTKHNYNAASLCSRLAETVIKEARHSMALTQPWALYSCSKSKRSTWERVQEGEKSKASCAHWRKYCWYHIPRSPQGWVYFSLKQNVNALSSIFKSVCESWYFFTSRKAIHVMWPGFCLYWVDY